MYNICKLLCSVGIGTFSKSTKSGVPQTLTSDTGIFLHLPRYIGIVGPAVFWCSYDLLVFLWQQQLPAFHDPRFQTTTIYIKLNLSQDYTESKRTNLFAKFCLRGSETLKKSPRRIMSETFMCQLITAYQWTEIVRHRIAQVSGSDKFGPLFNMLKFQPTATCFLGFRLGPVLTYLFDHN